MAAIRLVIISVTWLASDTAASDVLLSIPTMIVSVAVSTAVRKVCSVTGTTTLK